MWTNAGGGPDLRRAIRARRRHDRTCYASRIWVRLLSRDASGRLDLGRHRDSIWSDGGDPTAGSRPPPSRRTRRRAGTQARRWRWTAADLSNAWTLVFYRIRNVLRP